MPRPLVLLARALSLRCPNCGGGGMFAAWLRMKPHCPTCGLRTERGEQGYVVGAYMFNIMAAELAWGALFVGAVVLTWPDVPWDPLLWGGGVLMLALPFLFYPFSKTVFLAFDLLFRPAQETES
ncbi:MAG: DUF983 domain-containing protein [Gemmatimonadetes bacterium]|nr:DUF983 domain-containing protein [Gemmatimonadota bacterium]